MILSYRILVPDLTSRLSASVIIYIHIHSTVLDPTMSSGKSVPMLVFDTLYFSARIVMVTSRDTVARERISLEQLDLAVATSGRTTTAKLGILLETGVAVEHNDVDITQLLLRSI